jgi:hypothetical protein
MLFAVLRNGVVQVIDSEKTPVLYMLDSKELGTVSMLHAKMEAMGYNNEAHWAAADYPNTEKGMLDKRRDQFRMRDILSNHESFKRYVGDIEKLRGDSSAVIIPRNKIITP